MPMSNEPVPIETQRMRLRQITAADVENMVALDSDPDVMRFITGGRATPRREVERSIAASTARRWIAELASTGEFLGWFSLRASSERELEVGVRLRSAVWGNGYATEGVRVLLRRVFESDIADRVWGQTMTVNQRSRAVMERCGMRYVRTFHVEWPEPIPGSEHGDVEYEVTKADWVAIAQRH